MAAVLIDSPARRSIRMALGAEMIAVAVVTILRHREFSHAAPLNVLASLLVLAATAS